MVLVDSGAFYIDRTEVSNRAYRLFCERTGTPLPQGLDRADADKPVVNVSLDEAKAFAQWAQKRLPTAVEWEKAARGAEGRMFPWGNAADAAAANVAGNKGRLAPVESYRQGASPNGTLNLVGNVWEWVDSAAKPNDRQFAESKLELPTLKPPPSRTEPFYQLRGGSFRTIMPLHEWPGLVNDFTVMPARAKLPDLGFRCARSVDQ
jgi:serine/threonine-protein kinase